VNSLPYDDPRYWAREASICAYDGYPGIAAYCLLRHAREQPQSASPLLYDVAGSWMLSQLELEPRPALAEKDWL
jgi:hypothetical protein